MDTDDIRIWLSGDVNLDKDMAEVLANLGAKRLFEISLSRVYRHWQGAELAIVAAGRKEFDDGENLKRLYGLKRDAKSLGYGHIRLMGHGPEVFTDPVTGETSDVDVTEPSILVINRPWGKEDDAPQAGFREQMIKLAQKYNQSSLVYSGPEVKGELIALETKGGRRLPAPVVAERFASFTTAAEKYYSQLWQMRGGERGKFAFESCPVILRYDRRASGWIQLMGYHSVGDYCYTEESDAAAWVGIFHEHRRLQEKQEQDGCAGPDNG